MPWTQEEHDKALREIVELSGSSEEILNLVQQVRDDFSSRAVVLEQPEVAGPDWESEYNNLKTRYIDRFFSLDAGIDSDSVVTEQAEDVLEDGEEKTFEDLFDEREG